MRRTFVALLVALCTACFGMPAFAATGEVLKTFAAPKGAPLLHNFEVMVRKPGGEWLAVPTYKWMADQTNNGLHRTTEVSVASFEFQGKVDVKVKYLGGKTDSCRVRPLSRNIKPQAQDGSYVFTLDSPQNLSFEVNGDLYHNLQLFANPVMPKVKKGKNVIWFKPGYYELNDSLKVGSNQTVYIDGGAYIKGFISVNNARNVRIIGTGIVNPWRRQAGVMINNCKHVEVNGVLTTQLPVGGSDSVSVSNAKVMSWYGWGDGMNVFSSNHVSYNHVFCRTSDDCSTIYCTRKGFKGGCKDINVSDAVYWADVAHPIFVGLHGDIDRNEVIDSVNYTNIDILEQVEAQLDYQGCIAINAGDNNTIRNVNFNNIRIESLRNGMLFNFRVCYNKKYCHAPGRGIHNINLNNISYIGATPNLSIMTGYSADRNISDVHFHNLVINGRHIYDEMPGKPKWYKTSDFARIFVGEFVDNVSFK